MPMGIVSDSDFDAELKKLGIIHEDRRTSVPNTGNNNLGVHDTPVDANIPATVVDIKRGRGDANNVPDIVREIVAKSAINGEGTGAEIAEAFGVSPSSVSAYKVGATSTTTYHRPDDELLSTVIGHRKNISRGARDTLLAALDSLTPEKLLNEKARDLAIIAKNMSGIIVDMEPPLPPIQNQQNVQFVFMAPRVRSEDSYQIREVND